MFFYRKILSEYPYSAYKKSLLLRLKIAVKFFLNKKSGKPLEHTRYKYFIYINAYGHYLRAKEVKRTLLKGISNDEILIILNVQDKSLTDTISNEFNNVYNFWVDISVYDYIRLLFNLSNFVIFNKFKGLLFSIKVYQEGLERAFSIMNNDRVKNDSSLISFNDQSINISIMNHVYKEKRIIDKSIVYQHGIIGLLEFYFPSKSDFFYGYSQEEHIMSYFHAHNRYRSEFIAVGNLKYNRDYKEIDVSETYNSALIVLTPSWGYFLKTIKVIEKETRKTYRFVLRLHPAMKLSFFAKVIIKFLGLHTDAINLSFNKFDIIITEVSTVGLEALAEGKPVVILNNLNYQTPYYFQSEHLPKIQKITKENIESSISLCRRNKKHLFNIVKKYFG